MRPPPLAEPPDHFNADGTCSHCGSVHPDYFMSRLEEGTVELGPTGRDFKVYLRNTGGEPFSVDFAEKGFTRRVQLSQAKFHFHHLSPDQRARFATLLRENRLKISYPGYFVVPPFFLTAPESGI